MNNIEILEEFIKDYKELVTQKKEVIIDYKYLKEKVQAIENLIKENKELKDKILKMVLYGVPIKAKNYIRKSKILNFINNELPDDEICECCSNYDVNGVHLKNEIKKLLEEEE